MKNSKQMSLSWKDIGHGFLSAFLTAALVGICKSLKAGSTPTLSEVKASALIGLAAGGGYLLKKLGSNSENKFLVKEPETPLK